MIFKKVFLSIFPLLFLFSCSDDKDEEPCKSQDQTTNLPNNIPAVTDGQPAFPTAVGYAKFSKGGRGGQTLYVTNLNDSGSGSLRAALQQEGPRTILFAIAGKIQLNSPIVIDDPFVTIAGQTAPGDGVVLMGSGLYIATNDVVVRYLRIRPGDGLGTDPSDRDAIGIGENAFNVILDHVSASWAIDENISTWYEPYNITVQNSLISEALHNSLHSKPGGHSMGFLLGDNTKNITLFENVLASNNDRNPRMKGGVRQIL